ncbi:MAG: glycosyltransferase family 39 protein [Thermoanaerobaculia bacterium]
MRYLLPTVAIDERPLARWTQGERAVLVLWVPLVLFAVAFQLGSRALFDPDEGRNAEVMREMSVSGDYFVPRLNTLLFLDKPFLYFAAGGVAVTTLGANEVAVRLPGVLCTLALAIGVGALARRWWGGQAGALAAIATVAAPLPLLYSQIVIFDAMLTLWICTAVGAFYLAVDEEEVPSAQALAARWALVGWTAIALGILTKGPVALLVPLAAVLPWALWRGRARRIVARGAPLVLVAVIAPWLWAVSRADSDFLHYALVTETWSRLTSNELKRDAPVWFYLPVALFGILPWSVVPIAGWRRVLAAWRARRPEYRFLLVWFAVPYLLFSLMHSKRVHYILPVVPALVLLSIGLWMATARGDRLPGVRAAALVWLPLGLAMLALGLGFAPRLLARVDGATPETVAGVALALGAAWTLSGAVALASSRSLVRAFCALTLPPLALLLFSSPLAAVIGERRSARELARLIESDYGRGIEVVAAEAFPASLPFYLGRPLVLESIDGDPLRSNYILRRYPQMLDDSGPLRSPRWLAGAIPDCAMPRAFVVRRQDPELRELLAAAGRPMNEAGRGFVVFGPCAATATEVLEKMPQEPGAPLSPAPVLPAKAIQ